MKLSRQKASEVMNEWIKSSYQLPDLEEPEQELRDNLIELSNEAEKLAGNNKNYQYDVYFGIRLYEYFNSLSWFTMRKAEDDDFWRYIALTIIPDIIGKRYAYNNKSYYWSNGARIYPRRLWWYIHLSWQENPNDTEIILLSPNFSTDTILNLEERTGREGTYIDVYRKIVYYYASLSTEVVKEFESKLSNKHATLFRTIMKLNTAKVMVIEPELYLGGTLQYVRDLFSDVGVKV